MSAVCDGNMPEDNGDGETVEFKERLELDEFKRMDRRSGLSLPADEADSVGDTGSCRLSVIELLRFDSPTNAGGRGRTSGALPGRGVLSESRLRATREFLKPNGTLLDRRESWPS